MFDCYIDEVYLCCLPFEVIESKDYRLLDGLTVSYFNDYKMYIEFDEFEDLEKIFGKKYSDKSEYISENYKKISVTLKYNKELDLYSGFYAVSSGYIECIIVFIFPDGQYLCCVYDTLHLIMTGIKMSFESLQPCVEIINIERDKLSSIRSVIDQTKYNDRLKTVLKNKINDIFGYNTIKCASKR